MKTLLLLLLVSCGAYGQRVAHHIDYKGRLMVVETYERPQRDSVVAIIYGKPGRWDRPIISLTRQGRAYDHLLFIHHSKNGRERFWSYLGAREGLGMPSYPKSEN